MLYVADHGRSETAQKPRCAVALYEMKKRVYEMVSPGNWPTCEGFSERSSCSRVHIDERQKS